MAISQSTNSGIKTITLTYSAPVANMDAFLTDAARNVYHKFGEHGVQLGAGETVNDLTTAEIGQIIDAWVKKSVLDEAKAYHLITAEETARSTAKTENNTRYF